MHDDIEAIDMPSSSPMTTHWEVNRGNSILKCGEGDLEEKLAAIVVPGNCAGKDKIFDNHKMTKT